MVSKAGPMHASALCVSALQAPFDALRNASSGDSSTTGPTLELRGWVGASNLLSKNWWLNKTFEKYARQIGSSPQVG